MAGLRIRAETSDDVPFLREMGYEAASWRPGPRPPAEELLADPHLARYLEGWGREDDAALIAENDTGEPLGAAWYRRFTAEEPGYGFVDETIPELSIAVRADARGRGIGTELLYALADRARADGFEALSLSVEDDNRAARIYERAGFRVVERSGNALTMRLDLR